MVNRTTTTTAAENGISAGMLVLRPNLSNEWVCRLLVPVSTAGATQPNGDDKIAYRPIAQWVFSGVNPHYQAAKMVNELGWDVDGDAGWTRGAGWAGDSVPVAKLT